MIKAKALLRIEGNGETLDIAKATQALDALEATIKALEAYGDSHPGNKVGSIFISAARSFLKSGKDLMRRKRDKTRYNAGEKSILRNPLSAWMVEGSPAALTYNYNQLIERFNSSPRI